MSPHVLASAPKLMAGDRVAVLSPSFAAPGLAPAVHEQAMARLASVTGLVPVEYPTTRRLGASPEARAADLDAAFADPTIRAILATIGGDDQITVIPHLDADLATADSKTDYPRSTPSPGRSSSWSPARRCRPPSSWAGGCVPSASGDCWQRSRASSSRARR